MTDRIPHCPTCSTSDGEPSGFETGYVVDESDRAAFSAHWAEGPARGDWLGMGIRRPEVSRPIVAMRCTGCGRLDLFTGREVGR